MPLPAAGGGEGLGVGNRLAPEQVATLGTSFGRGGEGRIRSNLFGEGAGAGGTLAGAVSSAQYAVGW